MLLGCTEQYALDILELRVPPAARELAIIRLCANAPTIRLRHILDDLQDDYEWRRVPGYSKYEASIHGQIRRAAAGHGSMPGIVLRPKTAAWGHLLVNLSSDKGKVKSLGVHVAVCLAFHGPQPSPDHMVCHRDDMKANNTPGNLYWGTAMENARDRQRNWSWRLPDTPETQSLVAYGPPTLRQLRKTTKESMAYRLKKLAENRG